MRRHYPRILIPTDGSRDAARAIKAGVALAKALGASVNAVYVATPDTSWLAGAAAMHGSKILIKHYAAVGRRGGKKALAAVAIAAAAAGIACRGEIVEANSPWKGIVRVARARRCSVVVMVSRGRGALARLMRASQTAAVIERSKIPVLVIP